MPIVIAFDKVTYASGSLVSGHVVVVRKSPQKVKGLSMRFVGRSSVSAVDNSPLHHKRKEAYFDHKIDIFGHDGRDSVVGVGETLFPFSFQLPPGLPSSLVWTRGNILYFVEARLTRSSWKEDKKVSCRLNVEGTFDLNLDPSVLHPLSITRSKYVQHLLTKSGPLAFSLSTNKSGFLRGHSLPFHLQLKNLSKVNAKKVKVSLLQEVSGDGKEWSEVVEEIIGPAVPAGEEEEWASRITLPLDIPPTNLGNILNFPPAVGLNYFLQIELGLKSATVEPLIAKIPVIIGTVGLLRSRDRLRIQQIQQQIHTHEDACPLSQFSPIMVSQPPRPSCRHCHPSRHIHRRLRQLQRRRRESPPPSYDEAVGEQGVNISRGDEEKGQPSSSSSNEEDSPPEEPSLLKGKNDTEPSTSQGISANNKYVVTVHVAHDGDTASSSATL